MTGHKTCILIVDDDEDILTACRLLLKKHFGKVVTANKPDFIPTLMTENSFDAILLDMNFTPGENSGQDGLTWLSRILQIDPRAVVILVTAFSTVDAAVEAMKRGGADFIEKPWNNEKLVSTLKAAVRLRAAQAEVTELKQKNQLLSEDLKRRHPPILGESKAIKDVLARIEKVAPTDANVLILGENGTGKELVAREIHVRSSRAGEAFVSVDLGAVPETLFESELFGHRKGAFTGATENRMGRFQAADGGTLFLDEIGNLPLPVQPKLLSALETRTVTPLGARQPEEFDVRLISATNTPLEDLQSARNFRPDLLYRLKTIEIELPPLRERGEDISILANAFVAQYARKYNRTTKGVAKGGLEVLMAHSWPGNVRELRHTIERAVILSEGDELGPEDFSGLAPARAAGGIIAPQNSTLDEIEKASVENALAKHKGNISRAARELGLTRTSLYRRIEKYGL